MSDDYESVDFSFLNIPLKDSHDDDCDTNVDAIYVSNVHLSECIDNYARRFLLSDIGLSTFSSASMVLENTKSRH